MVIGITGMPGAGKSHFSKLMCRHWGVHLNLDDVGHRVLDEPQLILKLMAVFGASILDESGKINRKHLAQLVFETGRQDELNEICHPVIRARVVAHLAQPLSKGAYYIQDGALLHEAKFDGLCDFMVMIKTPFETRLERVVKNRNWSEKELRNRDAAQNERLKTKRSDLIIPGELDLSSLESLACRLDIAIRYHLATGLQLSQIEGLQGNYF